MIRSKAIAKKCHECSGDTSKEATLCQVFDCPLWEYRLGGADPKINPSKLRMENAMKNWKEEFETMDEMGIDITVFERRHGIPGALAFYGIKVTPQSTKTKS